MFSDEVLEKIFSDAEMKKIPVGAQATVVNVIERVLEEMEVEVEDATIRES